MSEIRVRFAPSPTGELHIGGARTALFNWLFARHNNGKFVLRIEDTDIERSTEESIKNIINTMKWLGIDWDEGPEKGGSFGPYYQSQRTDLYRKAAEELLAKGLAYYCYCTPEELKAMREQARKEGRPPRYDGRCRNLTEKDKKKLENEGRKPAIRFRVTEHGQTVVKDIIRGNVFFDNSNIDDFIIMKSNGFPTYNFACVIDDYSMKISHVIRAEEHISNTPKQILIYKALGYTLPEFAHVPMILAPDRSKLSKRHGATSVEEFRDKGYLSKAIINYLALLGWSPENDEEVVTLEKMVKQFSLEKVSKNPAIYDVKKLTWINGYYLKKEDIDTITRQLMPFLKKKGIINSNISGLKPEEYDYLKKVVEAVRDRVKTLEELADGISYFYIDDFDYEEKGVRKYFKKDNTVFLLEECIKVLKALEVFDLETAESAYRRLADELKVKAAELIHPTRLALTGRTVGPGLFDIIVLLGREECIKRLKRAVEYHDFFKSKS